MSGYKETKIKKDPLKERLRELKKKSALTPEETKEAMDKIIEFLGIK